MKILESLTKPFKYLFGDTEKWDRTHENNLNIQSINISEPKTPQYRREYNFCSGYLPIETGPAIAKYATGALEYIHKK